MKEFIEKLIERLEEKQRVEAFFNRDYFSAGVLHGYKDAISTINKLAEKYLNTSTDTSSGWITCSERLPDVSGNYLTYVYYDDYENKYYSIEVDEIDCDGMVKEWNRAIGQIVAWQPLPAAWKGVENGKK